MDWDHLNGKTLEGHSMACEHNTARTTFAKLAHYFILVKLVLEALRFQKGIKAALLTHFTVEV